MAISVPIVMYGLRLFIVVLQELQCLPNCLHVFMIRVIGCYHVTKQGFIWGGGGGGDQGMFPPPRRHVSASK